MLKRVTLLRRRPDLTVEQFRDHWAKPHAAIARGFNGLIKYNQNRVLTLIYTTGPFGFNIDGIVELWFSSDTAANANRTSPTALALTEDEPRFLSGLTALSAGEAWATVPSGEVKKFIILSLAEQPIALQAKLETVLQGLATEGIQDFSIDQLALAFTRPTLWSEPQPPNLALTIWLRGDAAEPTSLPDPASPLRNLLANETVTSCLYAVDELQIELVSQPT